MRVLLVGKGGREHALAWKIASSPLLTKQYVWPGHPGMGILAEPLPLPADASLSELVQMARTYRLDLVVVGPEAPLSEGLADQLREAGITTFGPSQKAARLESSKAFAKEYMLKAEIPTAAYELASSETECRSKALGMLAQTGGVVLKASGLAAGKGVVVCTSEDQVEAGLRLLYHSEEHLAAAAKAVVIEEVLLGRECSYFCFIGPESVQETLPLKSFALGFAVDFKRLNDHDLGPNTGGMGCYSPVPWLPADAAEQVEAQIVKPLLAALLLDDLPYCGCLYVGLMWSPGKGPQVVEFNVRFGDPEAEVLAMSDSRDWLALMAATCGLRAGALNPLNSPTPPLPLNHSDQPQFRSEPAPAVAVVMASAGYPFSSKSNPSKINSSLLTGKPGSQDLAVFGASITAGNEGQSLEPQSLQPQSLQPQSLQLGTGRALVITARGASFSEARSKAYQQVEFLAESWTGSHYRRDIALRVALECDQQKGMQL